MDRVSKIFDILRGAKFSYLGNILKYRLHFVLFLGINNLFSKHIHFYPEKYNLAPIISSDF